MAITRYIGVLNSEGTLAPAGIHDRESIITFANKAQVMRTLFDAVLGVHHPSGGRNLKGEVLLDTPGLRRDSTTLTIWVLDRGAESDLRHDPVNCWEVLHEVEAYPDFEVSITKRYAVKWERC